MNIDWVIACRYVEVHDNLGTIIGAGIDTIGVREIPGPVHVLLAIRLLAMAEELAEDVEHTATTRVRDPGGELLSEVGGPFTITAERPRPEWLTGIIVNTVVQFEAAEEGTYTIEFSVDEASAPLPIHIVRGPPPGFDEA